ncbi:GGDEF domain-containing protein [Spirochaeta isovalerica]|uniref:diguanylate cyclase n=1 Tax=Spirochaeta isovalerica TaxID=150 RepID=A0A841R805_9SPIO|nr:GGDEF domain-containing protein [Spirochaeta isovalerica]MBB6481414.1 diguanylate cyclase (GGDEF)-like protein [Spirochaeta isovalerica]
MEWEEIAQNPKLISSYALLKEIGILDYIEKLKVGNKDSDQLINEAYEIFLKESVDELVAYIIKCLSEKFIPSDLVFILNEGITVSRIKTYAYHNMNFTKINMDLDSLEPYEAFFRNYTGTTSFNLFEYELGDPSLIKPFEQFHPEIIVPIKGLSGLYGIILFGPKVLSEEYSKAEIAYIDKLMKFTSVGIQNNIHYEHSVKDSKTGLYNHNFFVSRVNEELARCRRTRHSSSLIVMDIDHFKNFNDDYGHLAGDEVIIQLAETLKHTVREEDILSRFGGEEFTVLLPETGREEAVVVGERLRRAVEKMAVMWEEKTLKVTVSIGISTYDWVEKLSEKTLIERADEALYKSKKNGRNQVNLYQSGLLYKANQTHSSDII